MDIPADVNSWLVFGIIVVSGYMHILYWKTKYDVNPKFFKKEFDVLLLSIVFSSLLLLISIVAVFSLDIITELHMEIEYYILMFQYMLIYFINFLLKNRAGLFDIPEKLMSNHTNIFKYWILPSLIISPIMIAFFLFNNTPLIWAAFLPLMAFVFIFPPLYILIYFTKKIFLMEK